MKACKPFLDTVCGGRGRRSQQGSSLIVVLMMLMVILVMGVIAARLSLFSEREARNDRDRQIAFQAAEAALLDAEIDMMGPNSSSNKRVCVFDSKRPAEFIEGCGTDAKAGMCLNLAAPGEAWKTVKASYVSETGTATANITAQYGQFTGQSLPNGSSGLPVRLPRYTIEAVRYAGTGAANDNVGSSVSPEYAFLVTAMGFGTRVETQVMLQSLVYKPANKPNSGC